MSTPAGQAPRPRPHWLGTLLYVPLLYGGGWLLARPLALVAPDLRPDQLDLASAVSAFALLLLTLPSRLRGVWRCLTPWSSLGLSVARAQGLHSALLGLAKATALLTFVTLGLLFSHQASWAGVWPDAARLLNVLALSCGVGLAEELLFRGWLWGELQLLASPRRALVLQAVIFALAHPWYREPGLLALSLLAGLMLLGVCLALERQAGRGSLWGAVALHGGLVGGWFLLQSGLLEVSPEAPSWWAGPGEGAVNPVGGLLGWVGLLGLLIQQTMGGKAKEITGLFGRGAVAQKAHEAPTGSHASDEGRVSGPR